MFQHFLYDNSFTRKKEKYLLIVDFVALSKKMYKKNNIHKNNLRKLKTVINI